MITLKRLQVENFKALSSVDLVFPAQGSVLIEGYNEAGKSTLFEAVYVALYGKPLVGEESVARLEEVIQHGQARSVVELTFHVGPQELFVTRIFERGKSQQASLTVHYPGAEPETVNRVTPVNTRILKELGNLDGESLRNSCFVEQKELGRIEALNLTQRAQAIQKLLGLEKLTLLIDQFKFKRDQERQLELAKRHLELACVQAEFGAASAQEVELLERRDAVRVIRLVGQLTDLEAREREVKAQWERSALLAQEARERLKQCDTLKEQMTRCRQMTSPITDVRHMHKDLSNLAEDLAQLEYIEQEALPAVQARLKAVELVAEEIVFVEQVGKQVIRAEADVREAKRWQEELAQAEAELQRAEENFARAQDRVKQRKEEAEAEEQRMVQQMRDLGARRNHLERASPLIKAWEEAYEISQGLRQQASEAEAAEAAYFARQKAIQRQETDIREAEAVMARTERAMREASDRVRIATGYDALTAWLRLKEAEDALSTYPTRQQALVSRRQEAQEALVAVQKKISLPLFCGISLSVLVLLSLTLGFIWPPVWLLALFSAIAALISWIVWSRARKVVRLHANQLNQCQMELQQLEMQRQATLQVHGDPALLSQHERELQSAGVDLPRDLAAGRMLHEQLRQELGTMPGRSALQDAAREARDNYTRASYQLEEMKRALAENREAVRRIQQAGDPTKQVRALQERIAGQAENVARAEQSARAFFQMWREERPVSSINLQALLSRCWDEMQSTGQALEQQRLTAGKLIQEAEVDQARAEEVRNDARKKVLAKRATEPAGQLRLAQYKFAEVQEVYHQRTEALQPRLQELQLSAETDVAPERGRLEGERDRLRKRLASRPAQQEEYRKRWEEMRAALATIVSDIEGLLAGVQPSVSTALPSVPVFSDDASVLRSSLSSMQAVESALCEMEHALQVRVNEFDELGTRKGLENIRREQGTLEQKMEQLRRDQQQCQQTINKIFTSRNISGVSGYRAEDIHQRWPLTAVVSSDEENQIVETLEELQKQLYALREQEKKLASELHYFGKPLNIEECHQKVAELIEEREIGEQATRLLKEAHDRIARRVLPITERNMQPLLQQLTGGRYRDVRLTPDKGDGQQSEMDYRIRVWDPAAGRFVAKNLFSGGTRDQCSLALRLAFALATLPQELGVAPGFIFLDEPLSAFDAPRARALVELLTSGTIAQQFSQVVLISHYHAFDREAFRYHVRIDHGQVIESDLPDLEERDAELARAQAVPSIL